MLLRLRARSERSQLEVGSAEFSHTNLAIRAQAVSVGFELGLAWQNEHLMRSGDDRRP